MWIDCAKTIGILLVVLGHVQIDESISNIIYSFHMSLFFFISGYLEKKRNFKECVANGIKTIIIPYFILYGLSFLWWFPVSFLRHPELFGGFALENGNTFLRPFCGMLFGSGYDTKYSLMINVPLWFLVGLFFAKIINTIIVTISKGRLLPYIIFNVVVVALVFVLKIVHFDLLFSLDSALLALPFFSMGKILRDNDVLKSVEKRGNFMNILIGATMFALLLMLVPINGRADINTFSYGNNIFLFYIGGMAGIMATLFLSFAYKCKNKVISVISDGTILIMAFSHYITAIIFRIIGLRDESVIINPILAVIVSIVAIMIMVYPIVVIKKYFPMIMGKYKKSTNHA
jgi:fucose 4-O-acetylase-like acetyltransferase